MSTKLSIRQQHKLLMNPVIHTFIGFLPLSRTEFIDRIKNEIDSNPMLEITAPESAKKEPENVNVLEKKMERADQSLFNSYIEDGFLKNRDRLSKNRVIELFGSYKKTLQDHLIEQAMAQFDKKELEIAEYIIYNLDADGYLKVELQSISSSINTTPDEIERVREIIKTFDPRGTASRTLRECLIAQIDVGSENKNLKYLIENHFETLAKSRFSEILSDMGIDQNELDSLKKALRRLEPRPGSLFSNTGIDYADVDLLLVHNKEKNEYYVNYVNDGIPSITLSRYYDEMLDKAIDKDTKKYLKDRLKNANLFIEGTALRKSMIEKIADFLVKYQKDFLDFGKKWKKPLTMKEVAKELGFSESTISRTVNNKYIATENGTLSLKSFFSHGIKGEYGFVHSVDTVKERLKKIIEDEPGEKPYSDQFIAEALNSLGIKISRRTVRNYREELNIPNSSVRKEENKIRIINKEQK